ncbi:MAG: aminotransferase class I/II-fold pyridoxal phosphate-dependent enzyme [Marinilabiliales bacterium]|nr:aminotransferase class I/II-fold pyridoxal phosphate-dependent enzyme [Marinilabiliales bacterium]
MPQGAFYVMPDVTWFLGKSHNGITVKDSDDLAYYLLSEARVAVVAGSAFGAPECIRISYATSDDKITEAVRSDR